MEKATNWKNTIDKNNDFLVLSNDIDSLLSCAILQHKFGLDIGYFMDFKKLYKSQDLDLTGKKGIGVDLDVLQGRTFSNHKLIYDNPKAINLNSEGGRYIDKYPFSTVILVMYTYNIDFNKFNDEQLKLLISIDSGYLGHYSDFFRPIHDKWLERMGLDKIRRILERTEKSELDNLQRELKLKATIAVNADGILETNIDITRIEKILGLKIELPKDKLKLSQVYETKVMTVNEFKKLDKDTIFSHAQTKKDIVKCSVKRKKTI